MPLDDPKHEAFARFIAQGKSKREAAVLAGFSKRTASSQGTQLAKRPKIAKRIEELRGQVAEKAIQNATKSIELEIRSKARRIESYHDIYNRMFEVIRERAADPSMGKVPGGKTGLVVRQLKVLGTGASQKIVPEYVVDVPLLREIRAHAQQAAEELGQWRDGKGDEGAATSIEYKWVETEPAAVEKEKKKKKEAAAIESEDAEIAAQSIQ